MYFSSRLTVRNSTEGPTSKSKMKGFISHSHMRVTTASYVCDTASWLTSQELRSFGDSEIKTHFIFSLVDFKSYTSEGYRRHPL
jgi:hypothetical protein